LAAQYDVCTASGGTRVVVVQSDLLDGMTTRVVIPLLPPAAGLVPMIPLNPVLPFDTDRLVLMPQLMATLSLRELGPPEASLAVYRDEITRALDMLLSGI